MNINETGVKFVGFFTYKKKIDGVKRKMSRMVCWEETLEEAIDIIKGRLMGGNATKLDEYYVAVYDVTGDESVKLSEHKIVA
jgi:hypothetical protein